MPTVDENKRIWDSNYDWSRSGEEWSDVWGTSDAQWWRALWPRIHRFLPVGTVLEIGPGFGRWTHYLKDSCERLIVVDLAEKCIEACRRRFAGFSHIEYHVTDGRSLDMVPDASVDFIFSFDSLVHASIDVLATYIDQLSRKLRSEGAGFIHHSNCGAFAVEIANGTMKNDSLRDETMSAAAFTDCAERAGLTVIAQEILAWGGDRRLLSDVISTFAVKQSRWDRPNRIAINHDFMQEASSALVVADLYHR
jgi:SAM-dependent methyltransferase